MKIHELKLKIILVASCILFSACAHQQRHFTRDEWMSATQKTYTGVTKEQLISAAGELLTMADKDDFQFIHKKNGFTASRSWMHYYVLAGDNGSDTWSFETEEKNGTTVATVYATTSLGSVASNAGGSVVSSAVTGSPIEGTAIYSMFWARLDYLLGLSNTWADCASSKEKLAAGQTWGELDHLCDAATLTNYLPSNLSDADIERIFKKDLLKKNDFLKKRNPTSHFTTSSEPVFH